MFRFLPCPDHNVRVPPINERERKRREQKRLKEEAALYRRRRSLGKKISQAFWGTLIVGLIVFHAVAGYVYGQKIVDRAFVVSSEVSFSEVDSVFSQAGVSAEKVTYQSELGPMEAWKTTGGKSTWVIHVHGKGGSPADFVTAVKALDEAGYPQLIISYRNDPGQPADPSGYHQHGVTEWKDLAAAVDYAVEQGAGNVVLSGRSMGAGAILSYTFRQTPGLITGLVLDSPSLDLTSNVRFAAEEETLVFGWPIPPTLPPIAIFVSSVQSGSNYDLMNYNKRAGQLVVPTLIIHGTEDQTVPIDTSRELAAARSNFVTLVEFAGADHLEAQVVDPERYISTLVAFVNSNS